MSKKMLPVIIVLVLLGIGAYYFMMQKKDSLSSPQLVSETINEATEFGKAIESGKPTTCTLTKESDVMEYQIKGKMMRIKTSSPKTSYMINDTKYLYMWSDDSNQGSKMPIPTEEETKAMADKAEEYQNDVPAPKFEGEADYQSFKDQGYTINCMATALSDDLFMPPTNIEFIDPTSMMQQFTMPSNGQGGIDPAELEKLKQQYGAQ